MFALVKFIEEKDAPGVVSTNWIDKSKNICFYPNVKSELQKNKLLIARAEPTSDWSECPIKLLKEFDTYLQAKDHLSEAEYTSNIESEEEYILRKRQRREKRIVLPGEDDSSDEDDPQPLKKIARGPSINPFPPPPASVSQSSSSRQSPSPSPTPSTSVAYLQTFNTPSSFRLSESESTVIQLKKNQELMWRVMDDSIKRIEEKLDRLINGFNGLINEVQELKEGGNSEATVHQQVLPHLPMSLKDLSAFEETLKDDDIIVRKKLVKYLTNVGGNDAKGFTANLMRKMFLDEVGDEYSLSGKSGKEGIGKKALSATAAYQLILDVCQHKLKEKASEPLIRGAVSDWLMQGKFRRARREERKSKKMSEGRLPDA